MFFSEPTSKKQKTETVIPMIFTKNILLDEDGIEFFEEYAIKSWIYHDIKPLLKPPEKGSPLEAELQKTEEKLNELKENALERLKEDYLYIYKAFESGRVIVANPNNGFDFEIPSPEKVEGYYTFKARYSAHGLLINIGPALPHLADVHQQKKILMKLFQTNKETLKETIDLPEFHFRKNTEEFSIYGSPLMISIANSDTEMALSLIEAGASVDKYAFGYGNNPLLLAITKGWNHIDIDEVVEKKSEENKSQKPIIEALLEKGADVNCIHLKNAMSPLHIACLRGDDPELIKQLIDHGADKNAVDLMGRTAVDLLDFDYEQTQKILEQLLDNCGFGQAPFSENRSFVATLPDRQEREQNIEAIRGFFQGKHISTCNP